MSQARMLYGQIILIKTFKEECGTLYGNQNTYTHNYVLSIFLWIHVYIYEWLENYTRG